MGENIRTSANVLHCRKTIVFTGPLYRSFHTPREAISAKTRVVHPTSTWVEVSSLDDPKDPAEKGFDLHRLPDRTPAR